MDVSSSLGCKIISTVHHQYWALVDGEEGGTSTYFQWLTLTGTPPHDGHKTCPSLLVPCFKSN
ncbi:hypothetical protein RP20_CCG014761 [Aedes albopictus]|nr:hypothetical protein RP20_CCG014761 [Aedes albopictus]